MAPIKPSTLFLAFLVLLASFALFKCKQGYRRFVVLGALLVLTGVSALRSEVFTRGSVPSVIAAIGLIGAGTWMLSLSARSGTMAIKLQTNSSTNNEESARAGETNGIREQRNSPPEPLTPMRYLGKLISLFIGGICGFILAIHGFSAWKHSGFQIEPKTNYNPNGREAMAAFLIGIVLMGSCFLAMRDSRSADNSTPTNYEKKKD